MSKYQVNKTGFYGIANQNYFGVSESWVMYLGETYEEAITYAVVQNTTEPIFLLKGEELVWDECFNMEIV
jgi:hypothetical protein